MPDDEGFEETPKSGVLRPAGQSETNEGGIRKANTRGFEPED